MAKILDGQEVKKSIINNIKENNIKGRLAIIRIGNKSEDLSYEKGIKKTASEIAVDVDVHILEEDTTNDEVISLIQDLNKDDKISGILIFRPLPKHLDENVIVSKIDAKKDVDCSSNISLGCVFTGRGEFHFPCTPKAVMEMLKYYNIDLKGKEVALIGKSLVFGKPMSMMLLDEGATVTICHSKTKNLREVTKRADIVIVGIGKAKFIDDSYFTDNKRQIVIDVGINFYEGSLVGDVDFEKVQGMVSAISKVPGGVGSVTNTILLKNVLDSACMKY